MKIDFASADQGPALMGFIDSHWRKGHVLAIDRVLFDWQYFDQRRGRYNFITATDDAGEIQAILGFIPLCQFDPDIELGRLVWLAIWRVTDAFAGLRLGKSLLDHLIEMIQPKIIGANAISDSAAHRYRSAGYVLGRLAHHYVVNPNKRDFSLLDMTRDQRDALPSRPTPTRTIEKIDAEKFVMAAANWMGEPRKSPRYYDNRYFRHPSYDYWPMRIRDGARTIGLLVVRQCEHAGARALRIVDVLGPAESFIGVSWDRWLGVTDAEYVDLYSAGLSWGVLYRAGFMRREPKSLGAIVPNYFEPFSRTNVEIDVMTSVPVGPSYRIFKGDSDQDRPNQVSQKEAAA
jgi:hypothetical protein